MRNILNKFLKKIKGDDFNLDKNIKIGYLFYKAIVMGIGLIRGNIKTLASKKDSLVVFVGKKTRLSMKNMISFGRGVNIGEYVVIDAMSINRIKFGSNVRIGDYSKIICSGSLRNLGKGVVIGNNCGVGENCFFGAAGGIEIGNDVIWDKI